MYIYIYRDISKCQADKVASLVAQYNIGKYAFLYPYLHNVHAVLFKYLKQHLTLKWLTRSISSSKAT